MLSWMGAIELDVFKAMPIGCISKTNFHTSLLVRTLGPLFVGERPRSRSVPLPSSTRRAHLPLLLVQARAC